MATASMMASDTLGLRNFYTRSARKARRCNDLFIKRRGKRVRVRAAVVPLGLTRPLIQGLTPRAAFFRRFAPGPLLCDSLSAGAKRDALVPLARRSLVPLTPQNFRSGDSRTVSGGDHLLLLGSPALLPSCC